MCRGAAVRRRSPPETACGSGTPGRGLSPTRVRRPAVRSRASARPASVSSRVGSAIAAPAVMRGASGAKGASKIVRMPFPRRHGAAGLGEPHGPRPACGAPAGAQAPNHAGLLGFSPSAHHSAAPLRRAAARRRHRRAGRGVDGRPSRRAPHGQPQRRLAPRGPQQRALGRPVGPRLGHAGGLLHGAPQRGRAPGRAHPPGLQGHRGRRRHPHRRDGRGRRGRAVHRLPGRVRRAAGPVAGGRRRRAPGPWSGAATATAAATTCSAPRRCSPPPP